MLETSANKGTLGYSTGALCSHRSCVHGTGCTPTPSLLSLLTKDNLNNEALFWGCTPAALWLGCISALLWSKQSWVTPPKLSCGNSVCSSYSKRHVKRICLQVTVLGTFPCRPMPGWDREAVAKLQANARSPSTLILVAVRPPGKRDITWILTCTHNTSMAEN